MLQLSEDILDFLASSPSTEAIINYHPSENLQNRMSELLEKNRSGGLSDDEKLELGEFLRMNRFMNRLKIKARQKIGA